MLIQLKERLEYYIKLIKQVEIQQKDCKLCNATGLIAKQKKMLGTILDYHLICKCQNIQEKDKQEINSNIEKIDILIEKIKIYIPVEYQTDCKMSKVDKKVRDFFTNDKIFCWIYGGTGTGKTFSIYARRINQIINNVITYKWLDRVKEIDFSYKTDYKQNIAIDDIGISGNVNRNINLSDLYYEVIDYKRENHAKMIMTSNYSLEEWLQYISKYNEKNAIRIESRLSNVIDIIELKGKDKRK